MSRYCPNCSKTYPIDQDVCPDDGVQLLDDLVAQMEGREIDGRYRVISRIGEGGMGLVYMAEQMLVGRKVALKVVRGSATQDRASVTRFFQEAKAIAGLTSPHTVTLYDFGMTEDGLLYYAMEMLEGESLGDRIDRTGGMPATEAVAILRQVLDSLSEAHDIGILHRDLKPGNVFLSTRRGQLHATVLDFGIAKLTMDDSAESVTKTGHICGTPAYISPELALGRPASPASDLYSIGVILYEMLTGAPPFDNDTPVRLLMRHISELPLPVRVARPGAKVSESIEALVATALAKQPEGRFNTCDDFLTAMDQALSGDFKAPEPSPHLAPSSGVTDGSIPIEGKTTTIMDIPIDPTLEPPHKVRPLTSETESALPLADRTRTAYGLWAGIGLGVVVVALLVILQPWRQESGIVGRGSDLPATAPSEDSAAVAPALAADIVASLPDVTGATDATAPSADLSVATEDDSRAPQGAMGLALDATHLDVAAAPLEDARQVFDGAETLESSDLVHAEVATMPGPDLLSPDVARAPAEPTKVADERPRGSRKDRRGSRKSKRPAKETKETTKQARTEKESPSQPDSPEGGAAEAVKKPEPKPEPELQFKEIPRDPIKDDDHGLDFKEIPGQK